MLNRYRYGSHHAIGILILMLSIAVPRDAIAEDPPTSTATVVPSEFGEWSDRTGSFTVIAKMITQDRQSVTLETDAGKVVVVPKARLDPSKVKNVHRDWLRQQDARQFELTAPHTARIGSTPDAVIELFLALHSEFDSAPYAGFFAGTLLSSESNDPRKAAGVLNQVISRIKSHRLFDPDAHEETYQSAINNLSVCYVKLGNSNAAASLLERACNETSSISLAAYHNATLLYEATDKFPFISLTAGRGASLLKAVTPAQGQKNAQGLQSKFAYSFEISLPDRGKQDNPAPSDLEKPESVSDTRTGYARGSGFFIAPGLVLTNRHVVTCEFDPDPEIIVRVGERPPFTSHIVRKVVLPMNGDLDLALLYTDELNIKPLHFSKQPPRQGAEIRILGFPNSDLYGFAKFMTGGTVNAVADLSRSVPSVVTDGKIGSGNSGGPAINLKGQVIGIAFAESVRNGSTEERRGLLVHPKNAIEWLLTSDPDLDLFDSKEREFQNWEDAYSATSEAVVLLEQYVSRDLLRKSQVAQPAEEAIAAVDLHIIFDHWCLHCSGRGIARCRARCTKGGIPRTITVKVGFNPLTRSPVTAPQTVYDKCAACKGAGVQPCGHCSNGKW